MTLEIKMTPERWLEVEDVLQAALDRPPHERDSFLDQACAGDDELKSEAAALVRAHDEAGNFIERPAIAQDARIMFGDQPDLNIGRVVGPYNIIERLGAGGMGDVYLAQDGRLNRLVALKILPAHFISDDVRLHRFQREARAASALNHPNIITIHEVGEASEIRFIATEFIDGQTIRELIARGDLSLAEVLDIALQVAFALNAAHAAGIVHRDIKPENIMRRADGIVKILDFGIAKLIEQPAQEFSQEATTIMKAQTEMGIVIGTVGYMSPEQARGLPVDERTDIWSLGVVLYEMLAGRAPFKGATRMDTLVDILEREPIPLFQTTKDAPPQLAQLQRIINTTLRKEKSDRYQSAALILADLQSVRRELDLAPAFKGQPITDSLLALRADRLRADQRRADQSGSFKPHASASAVNASSIKTLTSQTSARQKRARYPFPLLIAATLLLTVIAGTFLHRRWVARSSANMPGATLAHATNKKLYAQMSEAEQLAFINEQEQRISAMMGDRPAKLNDEALRAIKSHVDRYAARTGSTSNEPGKEDLRLIYARAIPYVPLIESSFAARKVPVVIGFYLPMIESEYKTCFENSIGAKGLFQFLPQTASQYGVAHEEMCDAEKMTPAAAHYIADRMAELGDDSESMTLVLLSYNRGPEWVRSSLRQLRNTDHYERNFWTLFANRDKLDAHFRTENVGYVPAFFAAAIIGENPQTFDLQTPPLSRMRGERLEARGWR
ncbi:MAG TPA: serine/threonine-protein kinase [Pyrinomonadaceae bacterium]|jgi:serine/threonine protein kinase|nr:serine/threonine-protein kinase [Pyrinomonadaceae bacterium]